MTDSEKLLKLKEALLHEDHNFANELFRRIESIENTINKQEALSHKVDPIITKKLDTFAEQIPEKLGPQITKALKVSIRDSQDQVVEALFPIIGKMIKKYIQNEMKILSNNINKQVQNTFSLNKIKNKVKSFFTGVSEESLILSSMTKAAVEQVFIIEKGSGILIHHVSKSEDNVDKEMIAGMLTAIKSFVEDAFTKENQNLELIQYELYNIYLQNFSNYYIALVVSGTFNNEFKNTLEDEILDFASKNKDFVKNSKKADNLIKLLFKVNG